MMLQISAEIRHSAGQFLMEYLFSRHSGFQGCDSKTLQLLVLDTLWNIAICWVFNWINTKQVKTLHKKIYFFWILFDGSCMLLQDHIQEVLDKWESIDDEIWAKVIIIMIVFPSSFPNP